MPPIARSARRFWTALALTIVPLAIFLATKAPASTIRISRVHQERYDTFSNELTDTYESSNETLVKRAGWWPFDSNMYLRLSDDAITALGGYSDEDKVKLRLAKKGAMLVCAMNSRTETYPTNANYKPGPGRSAQQILAAYGWSNSAVRAADDNRILGALATEFAGLGIDIALTDWLKSTQFHNQWTRQYPATFGHYDNYLALTEGAMVVDSIWSPEAMLRLNHRTLPSNEVVPFARQSDVAWVGREAAILQWEGQFDDDVKKLEHIIVNNIIYEPTKEILRIVTGKHSPGDIPKWPGLVYYTAEPQFLAALSSPHASGFAWMLSQHKAAMGVRVIDQIGIFACAGTLGSAWCMYLHIADAAGT